MSRVGAGAPRRSRTRRWVGLGLAVVLAFVGWIGVCVRYVGHPDIDPHERVDALYVLGPVETRYDEAIALMDAGLAPVMLATTSIDPYNGMPFFTDHCGRVTPTYRIECVLPDPYNTRGEAELLAGQVAVHGWRKVAILTSTPKASRARMLMQRCTTASVLVWDYPDDRTAAGWLEEFVHQSGGWVQAQLDPGC